MRRCGSGCWTRRTACVGSIRTAGASVIMPYLTYLSLVHGVGLDYPVLLARTFTSPFKLQARHGGLGVDAGLFDRHMARLTELGYATARTQLVWPLGRMLLHPGDPRSEEHTSDLPS